MKKALAGGVLVLGAIAGGGCFAFDWNYQAATGAGGGTGGASETGGGAPGGGGSGGGPALLQTLFFGEGKRLKPHYYDYGGGAVQLLDWYDTELGINCTFTTFSSSDVACVPRAADGSLYFADAACTQQLIWYGSNACPLPHYGTVSDTGHTHCFTPSTSGRAGYGGPSTIHDSGASFSGEHVYQMNNAACVAQTPSGEYKYLGDTVSVSSKFVTATIVSEKRGARLTELVIRGSDGSWQLDRPNDGLGQCLVRAVGDVAVCVSIFTGFRVDLELFTDATCTEPLGHDVGFVYTDLCREPEYIRLNGSDADQCPLPTRFFAAGDRLDAGPLWSELGGTCADYALPGTSAIAIGDELSPTSLPTAETEALGTGRVQARYYGTSKTEPLGAPFQIFDTAKSAACRAYQLDEDDDGVIRCVDRTYPTANYFSDAACTIPAVVASPNRCAETPLPEFGLRPSGKATGCETTPRSAGVYHLVAAPKSAFLRSGTDCTAATLGAESVVFTLGEEVAVDSLPKVAEILR